MNFLLMIILLLFPDNHPVSGTPSVCFTFDDGNPNDILDFNYLEWNQMILDQLNENNLQAIFYVCGKNMNSTQGKIILDSWNAAGHLIANHTYNHLNYNKQNLSYENYKEDILQCDSLINDYANYSKLFRAPFLKYGDTIEKRDSLISFLRKMDYGNGYVTIDNSDWYYNSRLIEFMKANPGKSIEPYKQAYISHLLEEAEYYDNLATALTGRKIRHSILLHHNLTSALFLGDLIKAFQDKGWQTIDAGEAVTDEIYKMDMTTLPAGESIIWSLAKASGKYDGVLRYPGEDSIYEEAKLDSLGL